MNRDGAARMLHLSISGIKARQIRLIGDGEIVSSVPLQMEADKLRTVRVLVTVAAADLATSRSLIFALSSGTEKREVEAVFVPGGVK